MFRWLALSLVLSSSLFAQDPANGALAEAGPELNLNASRANPMLREALSVNCPYDVRGGVRTESVEFIFREEWIDNQVDYFVKTIDSRLKKIRHLMAEANTSREQLVADSAQSDENAKLRWALSLRGLEEEARFVRTAMANAFPVMKLKDELKIDTRPRSEDDFCQAEMNQLDSFVATAEAKIRDYLFKPTHVADLGDLRGENMLTFLNRIERMAKKIRTGRFLSVPNSRR